MSLREIIETIQNRIEQLSHCVGYESEVKWLKEVEGLVLKLQKQLEEILEAEKLNHKTAKAMDESEEKNNILSHSWGRIQLVKRVLGKGVEEELNKP
jgi:hypothetical protein